MHGRVLMSQVQSETRQMRIDRIAIAKPRVA